MAVASEKNGAGAFEGTGLPSKVSSPDTPNNENIPQPMKDSPTYATANSVNHGAGNREDADYDKSSSVGVTNPRKDADYEKSSSIGVNNPRNKKRVRVNIEDSEMSDSKQDNKMVPIEQDNKMGEDNDNDDAL